MEDEDRKIIGYILKWDENETRPKKSCQVRCSCGNHSICGNYL